ncbi:MAG: AAA family ATPase [Candidatus Aminicenantes bacterium]|nr:AAA family ATPase [Candidatus Aminicenantes bacterium]
MKMKKLPIGISDFKDIITGNYYYVDKTLFIKEIIDSGDKTLLIPRPRRFGKTLNLSMVKYFYDCCPGISSPGTPAPGNTYKNLFDSLAILGAGQEYLDKIGKHPVIFLTFRNIKDTDWESCLESLKKIIQREYARHYYLLESQKLMPHEREYFQKIIALTGNKSDYTNSLENLLIFISRFYDERAVILIDEYDAPVHAGFTHGYYEEIINFIRIFLGGGLKDTDQYLEKGILTGIIDRYFSNKIENTKLEIMLKALIDGDIILFEKMLKAVMLAVFSYHDFGGEPEKVYHALVAGLLIWISNTHEIKSNRESGYGRYDIMIIPKDLAKIGYVIEFKTVDKDDNETVDTALEAAMAQIEAKKYETDLVERGIKHIKKLAIAFSGKEVFVKELP